MPDVLTMFFCGTSSKRGEEVSSGAYWEGELINKLRSNMAGNEVVDFLHYDGPGTQGKSGRQWLHQKVDKGSDSDVRRTSRKTEADTPRSAQADALGALAAHHRKMSQVLTEIDGRQRPETDSPEGYFHALFKVLAPDLQATGNLGQRFIPNTINLVGWSRGGVTCLTVANALDRVLTELSASTRINIFAVDPVPGYGSGDMETDKTRVPTRCNEFVGVYAMHARSRGFSAVIPYCPANVTRKIIWMPGRHATLVGNAHSDGDKGGAAWDFPQPGRVTRDLAEKKLISWGARFKPGTTLSLSPNTLLTLYEQMLRQIRAGHYERMSHTSYVGATQGDRREYIVGFEDKTAEYSTKEYVGGRGPKVKADSNLSLSPGDWRMVATCYILAGEDGMEEFKFVGRNAPDRRLSFVNEHHREVSNLVRPGGQRQRPTFPRSDAEKLWEATIRARQLDDQEG